MSYVRVAAGLGVLLATPAIAAGETVADEPAAQQSASTAERDALLREIEALRARAGVFFGLIYWSLESAVPGSFVGPDPFSDSRAVYYSFVTIATLGYGDYVPRTDLARGIATFEVIGGQLYLAALVARLIGMFTEQRR